MGLNAGLPSVFKVAISKPNLSPQPLPISPPISTLVCHDPLVAHEQNSIATTQLNQGIQRWYRILYWEISPSDLIATEELAKGLYFYELSDEKGIFSSGKIVKE